MIERGSDDWSTVVCIASGPSVTAEQCEHAEAARARGSCRIIAVNDSWRLAPAADLLYAADHTWWALHFDAVSRLFAGARWTTSEQAAFEHGLRYIPSELGCKLFPPGKISRGGNSGFQAIMVARHLGARRIILLGYDMQRTGDRAHWFGDHPRPLTNGNPKYWVDRFNDVAPLLAAEGIEVINCSAATALRCFPKLHLSEALPP